MTAKRINLRGFTIIEVLIVLAVAGLIMMAVFLAVPSLQRSRNNNDRRNDAARLTAAYFQVAANQARTTLPASWSDNAGLGDGAVAGQAVITAAQPGILTHLNISPYDGTAIVYDGTINYASSYRVSPVSALIKTGSKCAGPTDGTATVGTATQIAVYFSIDIGFNQVECINS